MTRITGLDSLDIRFPTSQALDGSDAMNPDPDSSAAYAILRTGQPRLGGHGLTFTIGRGNEICCRAIEALSDRVVGRLVNAAWDLWATHAAKPLWRLFSEMNPAELARCVDSPPARCARTASCSSSSSCAAPSTSSSSIAAGLRA